MVHYLHLHARLQWQAQTNRPPFTRPTARHYLAVVILLILALLFSRSALYAAPLAQPAEEPALSIETAQLQVMNDPTFAVPIEFDDGGLDISSLAFRLSFPIEANCPFFDDITDANADGIPDSVTGLPAGFVTTIAYAVSDGVGTIDVSVSSQITPVVPLDNGGLMTIHFGADDCRTDDGTKPQVTFSFSDVSFGDTEGHAVDGSATDGTKTLRFNAKPTDIGLTPSAVNENLPKGSTVGTLSSTDVDLTEEPLVSESHTYSLVSGDGDTDNSSFVIDSATLKTNAVFDFEAKNSYSIRVRTTDSYGGTFEKQFTITINDVNEAPHSLTLSATSVNENENVGTVVGNITAQDQDANPTFTFALVSGVGATDNASFTIGGDDSDELRTNAIFNYEVKKTYNIRLRVTDNGDPGLTLEKIFTISINDVNDAPVASDDTIDPDEQVIWEAISIPVLANDTDEDGDTLSITTDSVSEPISGTATISGTSILYTPAGDFNGEITFTYTASDDHSSGSLTSNAATVSLTVVADDPRGDCNADGVVNAGDFTAIVLEMFDDDASNKWYEIYQEGFPGSPLGCDANADQEIKISDLVCTVLVAFGDDSCTTPGVMAAGTTAVATLAVGQELVGAPNGVVNVPIFLATNGNHIAAASFALSLDENALAFDPTDADGDGMPDAVTFHTPPGMVKMVNYNRAAGQLEVALSAVMLPMPTMADGPLATVTVRVAEQASADEIPLDLNQASLGNDQGRSVPVEVNGGSVKLSQLNLRFFLPLVRGH